MTHIPGLRSPYAKVGRLVYFGRMIDKIRLHAAGKLPADYVSNLGDTGAPGMFDGRCCRFLGVRHADLVTQVLAPGAGSTPADDEKILAWAHAHGSPRTDEECTVWNYYMAKLGWRDAMHARVKMRVAEGGTAFAGKKIETFFDCIDTDEGRDPEAERLWEKIQA
jgi:gluconokinase